MHVDYQRLRTVLYNLGIFSQESDFKSDQIERQQLENRFLCSLWDMYFVPLFTDHKAEFNARHSLPKVSQPTNEIRFQILSEVLNTLCSPQLTRQEKVQILGSIQRLFNKSKDSAILCPDDQLMAEIIEPFSVLFADHFTDDFLQNLARTKRDLVRETYHQCTFAPETNGKFNDQLAKRKYDADMGMHNEKFKKMQQQELDNTQNPDLNLKRPKKPVKTRIVVMHIDAKHKKDKLEEQRKKQKQDEIKGCSFVPKVNHNIPVTLPLEARLGLVKKQIEDADSTTPRDATPQPQRKPTTSQIREQEELKLCTFKPKLIKSFSQKIITPQGVENQVQRMKDAIQLRKAKDQRFQDLGKPKLARGARSPDGRTVQKSFYFLTDARSERKGLIREAIERSRTPVKKQEMGSRTPVNKRNKSLTKSPYLSPERKDYSEILKNKTPSKKFFPAPIAKITRAKLFDVDVKIAKDTVVRLEMSEGDDPWIVSKQFQTKYNLSNIATAALYNLLSENYNRERNKIHEEKKDSQSESIHSYDLKPDSARSLSQIISEATDETDRESRMDQVSASVADKESMVDQESASVVNIGDVDDSCIEIIESFQESNRQKIN